MSTGINSFYVTGGTLRQDAPCYVERQADRHLHEGLQRGEFCYVLTARQMGKSSLMVHTAARLRQEGTTVAILDLTAIGQNLSPEQWYGGLLRRLGRQIDPDGDLDEELEEYWFSQEERVGPLERWMQAVEQQILPRLAGRLVIFIDEIDAVRSLSFSTDEFFAAIRECYNRRSHDPQFVRLTFCLLGVAAPSDLIRDTRMTPFNMGKRIEITDFTATEAAPLTEGLGRDSPTNRTLLQRVLYWTGGHPYLTQRLCQAVAEDKKVASPAGVDQLCETLFLSPQAQERDDNLLFVRERLLKSELDRAGLLDLYAQVQSGKRVRLDDTNQLVSLLRLSGITRVTSGSLHVRNRIYERVFDREWIAQHMPDAELRRQRAAYRRGLVRAATVSTLILAVVVGLAFVAMDQALRAKEGQKILRRHLYAAQMKVALQAWNDGSVEQALALLDNQRPQPGQEDLRGFEWRYLWRLCHQHSDFFTLQGDREGESAAAFSPVGQLMATVTGDGAIRLWDWTTRREVARLGRLTAPVKRVAFLANGKFLITLSGSNTMKLWDVATRQELGSPQELPGHFRTYLEGRVPLSGDRPTIVLEGKRRSLYLWDLVGRRELASLTPRKEWIGADALSPDGRLYATGSKDNGVELWDVAARRRLVVLKGHASSMWTMAFSPDGKILATGSDDSTVRLWNVITRKARATFRGHQSGIYSLAFSLDGRTLASGSDDATVRLWDVATGQELGTLRGHAGIVTSVSIAPDGKTVLSVSGSTIKLWHIPEREVDLLRGHKDTVPSIAFSPNGKVLASTSWDGTVRLWDLSTRRALATLGQHKAWVTGVAFSPDGKTVASGTEDRIVRLWDLASRRVVANFAPAGATGWKQHLVYLPDGKSLATGDPDGRLKVWDTGTHREVAAWEGHRGGGSSLGLSPNGKILAGGDGDGTLKLWDIGTRREIATRKAHDARVMDLAFSPDGEILATASQDRTVRLWDIERLHPVAVLKGHASTVDTVAFSPDGRTLATGGHDHTVRLWSVAMKQEVAALKEHTAPVAAVAFSPDGNLLASGSGDGTIRLWHAARFAETDVPAGTRSLPSSR